MKNLLKQLLLGVLFTAAIWLPVMAMAQEMVVTGQSTGNITVKITNLKNDQGQVKVLLANSEETFITKPKDGQKPDDPKPFQVLTASIKEQQAEVVFENLPFGVYAVMVFHDENGNGKMDRNFLGVPKEAHAFSNNVREKIGRPPTFKKTGFELNSETVTITITMQ